MEGRRPRRLVRDRLRFFNQPAGMLQNLYAGVESLWKTFFGARLATKCWTQDSRGQNVCRVGESISGTWMSRNLSRGSGTLGVKQHGQMILSEE